MTIDIPGDANVIALVGENGSGKTNLLELLSFAAHFFGLAPGLRQSGRQLPPEGARLRITMNFQGYLFDPEQLRRHLGGPGTREYAAEQLELWDQNLELVVFAFVPPDDERPEWLPPGTTQGVAAGGDFVGAARVSMASAITSYLQTAGDVHHLFLDADRAYGTISVQDAEILEAARRDPTETGLIRQHAATLLSANQYVEWVRAWLGLAERDALDFTQQHRVAAMEGRPGPEYVDPFDAYRQAVQTVLPHLRFIRPDQQRRTLLFEIPGAEVSYEELSGGEQEVSFLLGQLERFGLRRGLLLLDEPELHLNAELLRRWLSHVKETATEGQVWIGTHALEAAEVAGESATIVLERGPDGYVRSAAPLGDRPVLQTLAGALGSPAFSLSNSRFILIEGDRPGRERERFSALCPDVNNSFLEVGGCLQVVEKLDVVLEFAHETTQLRVGGVIDQDHRDTRQCRRLAGSQPIHVLRVFEVENFFLYPPALMLLAERNGQPPEQGPARLLEVCDAIAGQWLTERVAVRQNTDLGVAVRARASKIEWASIEANRESVVEELVRLLPSDSGLEPQEFEQSLNHAIDRYETLRTSDELWKACMGKEAFRALPQLLGLANAGVLERQVLRLYATNAIPAPPELEELREYVRSIPEAG